MKKIAILILALMLLSGCASSKSSIKPDFDSGFEVKTYAPDMSAYKGISSTKHMFKGTTVSDLKRTIDEKGYGVFYLGYSGCYFCNACIRYLNEVAEELGVYVYYIDAHPNNSSISDEEIDLLYEILDEVLDTNDEGEKAIFTPHVFAVINGEIVSSQISGTPDWEDFEKPTEQNIKNLKKVYREMLTPFVH